MPSHITFAAPPTRQQISATKMSLSQTYFIAASARTKLGREASRADHNLRRLVGHANLLDSLMVELADAEREQERWFNSSIHQSASTLHKQSSSRQQWVDTIVEEDNDTEDSDSDSDDEDYEDYINTISSTSPLQRIPSPPAKSPRRLQPSQPQHYDEDSEEEYYDDEEDLAELTLTRTASNVPMSPPELIHDSDSEDESSSSSSATITPPTTPPQVAAMDFSFAASKKNASLPLHALPSELMNVPMIAALA